MIYVNGDSHSAGADIIPGICFAQDDPRYLAYGRRAHPEAIVETFGYHIAQAWNQGFFCEAESASSNARILRTTKNYIENTKNKDNIGYIIIGWTSWEREEWQDPDNREVYYQVTASGTDSVAPFMEEEYKRWVIRQTPEEQKRKEQLWHKRIWDFHCELKEQNIRHIFFNSMHRFTHDEYDWDTNYIQTPFCEWAKQQGFATVLNSNHYGADAHKAFGNFLLERLTQLLIANNHQGFELGLTEQKKRSIVTRVKQQFKGFNQ